MSESSAGGGVKFHYIKGNFFRVIHADGVLGGITPSRGIFMSLFSERGAIPKMIELAMNADGSLGGEIDRDGKEGLVREVEIGVMLDAKTARDVAEWLLKQVEIWRASKPEPDSEKSARSVEF